MMPYIDGPNQNNLKLKVNKINSKKIKKNNYQVLDIFNEINVN